MVLSDTPRAAACVKRQRNAMVRGVLNYRTLPQKCFYFFHGVSITCYADAVSRLSQRRLSVCLSLCVSVTLCDPIKTLESRITKSSLSAPWKNLVSGSVKLFPKFERGHPDRRRKMRGGRENQRLSISDFQPILSRRISETVRDRTKVTIT